MQTQKNDNQKAEDQNVIAMRERRYYLQKILGYKQNSQKQQGSWEGNVLCSFKTLQEKNSVPFKSEGRMNTFLQKDLIYNLC